MAAQAKILLKRLKNQPLSLLEMLPVSFKLQNGGYQRSKHCLISYSKETCRFQHTLIQHKAWQRKTASNLSPSNFMHLQMSLCTPAPNVIAQQHINVLHAKKRPQRKRPVSVTKDDIKKDEWLVVANATAEEYDLESLNAELKKQGLYQSTSIAEDLHDVLHVSAKYQTDSEPREIYFFREGSVVFWNVPEIERYEVMRFLRNHETNCYEENLILEEGEVMTYMYAEKNRHGSSKARLVSGKIALNCEGTTDLEKYTFSNGMALSVKLGLWEASLDQFVDSIEWITENMRTGKKVNITQDQVFRKTGELYALRHHINLSSDLLDTPDFYWDRQNLEDLYQKTCNHLNISKRTKVMNEKLNHCCELMQLLSHHLSDNHHVRLELMIIALILVEVVFEFLHWQESIVSLVAQYFQHSDEAPDDS